MPETDLLGEPKSTIDGVVYELTLWPTSTAMGWLERLARLTGEPAAYVLHDDWPIAIRTLLQQISAGQQSLGDLVRGILVDHVRVVGPDGGGQTITKSDFELRFRGKPLHAIRVAAWVLRENLADFTEGVRSIAEALEQRLRDALKNASAPTPTDLGRMAEQIGELVDLESALSRAAEGSSSPSPQTSDRPTGDGG